MPNLSIRSGRVPESPFRKLAGLGEAAKARGVRVIHLNIGQPDIPTPPQALERLRDSLPAIVAYSPGQGSEAYRKQLCQYYARFGVTMGPEHLLITAGASEALQLLCFALADAGDSLLSPEPYYANYHGFAEVAGLELIGVPSAADAGFPMPAISEFERRLRPDTKGILLNIPGNPAGNCYAPEEVRELLAWAVERDLFVVVDEVYREFVYDGKEPFCSLAWGLGKEHLIVIDSISKRYSACGARIGNVASFHQPLMQALGRYAKLRLSPPVLGERLASYILKEEGDYLPGVIAEYDRRRKLVYQRLTAMEGVETYLPGGAFYCFARLPIEDGEAFCRYLLDSFTVDGTTVMLSPGSAFHSDPEKGRQLVRIAFIRNLDELSRAMDILEAALAAYPRRLSERPKALP